MFKRILVILMLACLLPMLAHAYTLTTRINSFSGQLQVNAYPVQTSGVVTRSISNGTVLAIFIAPASGYVISKIQQNTYYLTVTPDGQTVILPSNTTTSQTLNIWFDKKLVAVTASAGTGGSVTPNGTLNLQFGTIKSYVFTPATGNKVISISCVPSSGVTLSPTGTCSSGTCTSASWTTGVPVALNLTVPATPVTMNGVFKSVIANAGTPQTVLTGSTVTLDGSASSGAMNFAWSQTAGIPVTLINPTAQKPIFAAAVTGSNQFMLVADDGAGTTSTDYTTVIVTDSAVAAAQRQCQECHQILGIGVTQNVYGNWSLSPHSSASPPVMCYGCHIGTNSGGHPGQLTSGTVSETTFNYNAPFGTGNYCVTCHSTTIITDFAASRHFVRAGSASCSFCHVQGVHNPQAACIDCHNPGNSLGLPWPPTGLEFHDDYTGTKLCTNCHNLHSAVAMPGTTHFNNVTSAGYPASYVTSRSACANCHFNSPDNATRRQEWNKTGHAAITNLPWTVEDFKTRSGCVQCHTTTGFIAYSTGRITAAWGDGADKTKEVLTCIGCHKDVPNGIVRTVVPVRPYADDPYTNRNVGKSNICMACHSGRKNGASITAQLAVLADFTNLPFIDPHYRAAGGVLHGKVGYHFTGQTYAFYSTNSHRRIGIANSNGSGTSGPCVACHRDSTNAHTNKSLISTLCGNCHGASLPAERLNADKQAYVNALAVLNAMLAAKGHPCSPSSPYFNNTNWGTDQIGANTMGAAFNYVLLLNEPGAYAHNSAYAKQLIFNSIDYLYNGTITGSIETAVASLIDNGINQAQADNLIAYKHSSGCTSCHANTSGSHPAHLDSGFGCVDCHSATAATNATLVPGNTTHINGMSDLQAGPGRSFSYSGETCSSISCHNYGTATWGGTLGCDGCHDAPPNTASHLKHYGGTIAQAGYGNIGIARDVNPNATAYIMNCGNCHPMDKTKHGNGVVDVELYNPLAAAGSLKALNPESAAYVAGGTVFTDSRGLNYTKGTCSNVYCHSYDDWTTTAAISVNDPNWQAKVVVTRKYKAVTWGGAPLTCSGCHGNPTQTSTSTNDGGAGDSHSWIDPYGYQNMHTWNMGFAPLSCSDCHNDTVKQPNTYTEDGMGVRTLSAVPISNFSKHVNGRNDVAFDTQKTFNYSNYYGAFIMSLANATYDPGTKNCSNVSCHIQETTVKWGTPYRWYTDECYRCHGYSGT